MEDEVIEYKHNPSPLSLETPSGRIVSVPAQSLYSQRLKSTGTLPIGGKETDSKSTNPLLKSQAGSGYQGRSISSQSLSHRRSLSPALKKQRLPSQSVPASPVPQSPQTPSLRQLTLEESLDLEEKRQWEIVEHGESKEQQLLRCLVQAEVAKATRGSGVDGDRARRKEYTQRSISDLVADPKTTKQLQNSLMSVHPSGSSPRLVQSSHPERSQQRAFKIWGISAIS